MNQFNETICFQTKIVTAEGSPYYLNRGLKKLNKKKKKKEIFCKQRIISIIVIIFSTVTGETSWDAPPAAPAPTPNLPPGWIVQYTQE